MAQIKVLFDWARNTGGMAISFHPKAGMVLMCDFRGMIAPEIVKVRPVVVISPSKLRRKGLCTVVPLSTTAPDPVELFHCLLPGDPLRKGMSTWAKCDLVQSVAVTRLDRIRVGKGQYVCAAIPLDLLWELRRKAAVSLSFDYAKMSLLPAKAGL